MKKKNPISPEDTELFQKAVEGAKPIKQGKHHPARKKTEYKHATRRAAAEYDTSRFTTRTYSDTITPTDWLSADDTLYFARTGLQHKLVQRLRRGQVPVEAHIDLHRKTIEEAMKAVAHFLDRCTQEHVRWACIVHGKGHYSSSGKPVLKTFLNQWLREQSEVLAFHSAKPKDGGTGALYVLLKGKKVHEK